MTKIDSTPDDHPQIDAAALLPSKIRRPPLWERHPTLTAGLISLLAALVAGAIGFLGAQVGAQTSLNVAKIEAEAEDNRIAQDRRDVVYKGFLDAANTYFYAWDSIENAESLLPLETEKLRTARFEYRGHLNEVYVHGSEAGWAAAKKVNSVLPPSAVYSPIHPATYRADPVAFQEAFKELLDIRCGEATPVLRNGCSQNGTLG